MPTTTNGILLVPEDLLMQALNGESATGVDILCDWWNSIAPEDRKGADHFGTYVLEADDLWANVYRHDRTRRFLKEFADGGSCARYGGVLFEFRRAEMEDGLLVSYDLRGQAIEGARVSHETFKKWAAQSLSSITQEALLQAVRHGIEDLDAGRRLTTRQLRDQLRHDRLGLGG